MELERPRVAPLVLDRDLSDDPHQREAARAVPRLNGHLGAVEDVAATLLRVVHDDPRSPSPDGQTNDSRIKPHEWPDLRRRAPVEGRVTSALHMPDREVKLSSARGGFEPRREHLVE